MLKATGIPLISLRSIVNIIRTFDSCTPCRASTIIIRPATHASSIRRNTFGTLLHLGWREKFASACVGIVVDDVSQTRRPSNLFIRSHMGSSFGYCVHVKFKSSVPVVRLARHTKQQMQFLLAIMTDHCLTPIFSAFSSEECFTFE